MEKIVNRLALPTIQTLWAVAVLLGLILLVVAYCSGRSDGKQVIEDRLQAEREAVLADQRVAERKAEQAREIAAQKAVTEKKDLDNAVLDTRGLDRTVRGCIILRQQGRDVSNLPACQ